MMKSSTLAASAAPESWQPAPPDANVVCAGPLHQFATTPDEEHALRELADRKLSLRVAGREQRLAMETVE